MGGAEETGSPSSPAAGEANLGNQKPLGDAVVTPQASADVSILSKEEKIEYRDQDGNLLNEEQVAALEGKVSFSTRYETRTKLVDEAGNEISESSAGAEGIAPPHPDVDREPETAGAVPEDDGRDRPATASPEDDLRKEKLVEKSNPGEPRPASEANEATK